MLVDPPRVDGGESHECSGLVAIEKGMGEAVNDLL